MLYNQRISVIIPALNEAASVGKVIAELPAYIDDVVVVDNGSIDGTDEIARDAGARVIYQHVKGYGAACLAGIRATHGTDIVAFIDADYSDYPAELHEIIEPVAKGVVEFSMGAREHAVDQNNPFYWHQAAGNRIACALIRLLHGARFCDLGPMRCLTRKLLDSINMQDESYGWTAEMQIRISCSDARFMQIPVRYRKRIGQSKISGTVKGSVLAAYKIIYWTIRLAVEQKRSSIRSGHDKSAMSMVNR